MNYIANYGVSARYVSLFYVDYRDSLDEHEDIQEKCLRSNSLESLYEKSFEWYESQEQENLEEYMDETRRNMEKAGLSGLFKEHEEQIRDLIYERNDSNPAKDLIRNSCDTNLFYSLGVEIDGYSTGCPERVNRYPWHATRYGVHSAFPKENLTDRLKNSLKTLHTAENYGFTSMPGLTDSSVPERRRISNVSASAEMWWWPSLTAVTVQVITYTFPWTSPCRSAGRICLWIHRYIIPMRLRSAA